MTFFLPQQLDDFDFTQIDDINITPQLGMILITNFTKPTDYGGGSRTYITTASDRNNISLLS